MLIYAFLVKLSASKATGIDKISSKVLQVTAFAIASSCTEIFDMFIDLDE